MDRSWILHYQNRFSDEYIAGVNSFIDFAKANSGGAVLINCPCNDCCNHQKHDYETVRIHLHIQGMMVHYLRWIYHGEPIVQPDNSDESKDESEENQDEYNELIENQAALQSLPIQPLTTQPPPTQAQPSQPPMSPHTFGSSVASAPASDVPSRVRGVTQGKNAAKLRRLLGHNIPVPIPSSSHRPEGEHAPSLANHLGLAIREVAPVRPHGWKKLDSGIKLSVIAVVKQLFEIGDYEGDMQLRTDIDRQCGILYRGWKYELHTHYIELLEQGVPRPQDHPAEGCTLADWQQMISQCWESPTWKAKSKKAQESRAQLPYNHTSGSRSFTSRMSLMAAQNAGQAPPLTQFFRDTHYRRKSNEWVNEVAQQRHEALVQRIEEQLQPSVTTPMAEEQIAVDVLGRRSGYVKGYGIYSRTSSSSTQSRAPDPEVIALREQLAEQGRRQSEQLAEQGRRQAEQDRRTRQLEALVQRLAAVAGIDPAAFLDTTGGTTSTGDGTAPGGS